MERKTTAKASRSDRRERERKKTTRLMKTASNSRSHCSSIRLAQTHGVGSCDQIILGFLYRPPAGDLDSRLRCARLSLLDKQATVTKRKRPSCSLLCAARTCHTAPVSPTPTAPCFLSVSIFLALKEALGTHRAKVSRCHVAECCPGESCPV